MSSLVQKIINCAVSSEDSQELIVRKQTLTLMALIIGVAATIWGAIYTVYGRYLSASIPLSYAITSAITLYYASKTKKHLFFQNSQLVLVLFLPFFLMWSLGGFGLGSYVMIWGFFAPLAAVSFQQNRSSIWFILFALLTILSAFIEHSLHITVKPLPEGVINSFMVLNIVFGFGGIFLMLSHYVKTQLSFSKDLNLAHEELKKKNDELELLANYDHLTKLLNRCSTEKVFSQELARARRHDQLLSIVLLDIDNFKSINDLYGHNNGDLVLKIVSKLISESIRSSDHVGRWGGEEFLLVLPQTSQDEGEVIADKLRISISKYDFDFTDEVTCSFGISLCKGELTIESYINKADVALYQAKNDGKNCVKAWDDELHLVNT